VNSRQPSRFDPLAGLDTPTPSPDLRRRTLTEARLALARSRRPDIWERLWSSRGLRLAWATSLAALIVGHVLLSSSVVPEATPPANRPSLTATLDPELRAELALQKIHITKRADFWLGSALAVPQHAPSTTKETDS
jgi:hypothetical protein